MNSTGNVQNDFGLFDDYPDTGNNCYNTIYWLIQLYMK